MCAGGRLAVCGRCLAGRSVEDCQNTGEDV